METGFNSNLSFFNATYRESKQWYALVDKKPKYVDNSQDRDHTCRKLVSIGGAAILLILLPWGRRPEFGVLFVVIAQTQIIRQLTHNFASPVLKGRSRFRRIHILLMFNCLLALLSPKPNIINRLVTVTVITENKLKLKNRKTRWNSWWEVLTWRNVPKELGHSYVRR